jgi:hypothetical protein
LSKILKEVNKSEAAEAAKVLVVDDDVVKCGFKIEAIK